MLTIDGLDVLKLPGQSGNSYGTDPTSVQMTEAGSGTVSSLSFEITDPAAQVTLAVGQFVRFWDITLDVPIFTGWIESFRARRLGIGRKIRVSCIGIEALLDWMYVPAMTIPANTEFTAGFQLLVAAAGGIGYAMNVNAPPGGGISTRDTPVGIGFGIPNTFTDTCVIAAGTLRQALQTWGDSLITLFGPAVSSTQRWGFTVDFYGGLRIWKYQIDAIPGVGWSDAGTITLSSAGGAAQGFPADTDYGVDGSGISHSVYVSGSGGGSGFVSDGSGQIGKTAALTDANSTNVDKRLSIGAGAVGGAFASANGSVVSEGGTSLGTPASQRRAAASFLSLRDDQSGITAATRFWITSIDKTWAASGEERWVIKFGAAVARGSQYLRRLTVGVQV